MSKGLASAGAIVYVGSRHQIEKEQDNVTWYKIDIRSMKSIKAFINRIDKDNKRIDVWINCAWPKTGINGPIESIPDVLIQKETLEHLLGFYSCCKTALSYMKKQGHGNIINFGSIYGELSPDFRIYTGTDIYSSPAYSMIKGGIHSFTKYLACEAACSNIRVNAICPGGVFNNHDSTFRDKYSNRVPLKRMATPDELVGPTIFLASEASSYVTGQLIFVDGGLTAW